MGLPGKGQSWESMSAADSWFLDDLGIPSLWQQTRGDGIRVAVLDTGVAPIPDTFKSLTALAPDGSPATPGDTEGHGTACASLIASINEDAPGIAPDVDLLAIRVCVANSPIELDVRRAFQTAIDRKCNVISCSFTLGTPADTTLNLVRAACSMGIVVVAASGDDPNIASGFPERTPNVLVVGAYDSGKHPIPQRTGPFTDVFAPGTDLPVLLPDGQVGSFGDTSGAAAVTAGVVALILSACRAQGTARVGVALEGLARATAVLLPTGERLLDPARLLRAATHIP